MEKHSPFRDPDEKELHITKYIESFPATDFAFFAFEKQAFPLRQNFNLKHIKLSIFVCCFVGIMSRNTSICLFKTGTFLS